MSTCYFWYLEQTLVQNIFCGIIVNECQLHLYNLINLRALKIYDNNCEDGNKSIAYMPVSIWNIWTFILNFFFWWLFGGILLFGLGSLPDVSELPQDITIFRLKTRPEYALCYVHLNTIANLYVIMSGWNGNIFSEETENDCKKFKHKYCSLRERKLGTSVNFAVTCIGCNQNLFLSPLFYEIALTLG